MSEKKANGRLCDNKNSRWRINNNLLGDVGFCPTIKRTNVIMKALELDYPEMLRELSKNYSAEILNRANNYLYKKETRSSYQIEKEEPTPERIERFVSLLSNTGKEDVSDLLSEESLVMLQNQIVDPRFAATGFCDSQNYIGQTTWNYDEAKELLKQKILILINFKSQSSGHYLIEFIIIQIITFLPVSSLPVTDPSTANEKSLWNSGFLF